MYGALASNDCITGLECLMQHMTLEVLHIFWMLHAAFNRIAGRSLDFTACTIATVFHTLWHIPWHTRQSAFMHDLAHMPNNCINAGCNISACRSVVSHDEPRIEDTVYNE